MGILFLLRIGGVVKVQASIAERVEMVKEVKAASICSVLLIRGSFSVSSALTFTGNFDQLMCHGRRGEVDDIVESDIFSKIGLWSLDNSFKFNTSV